MPTSPRATTAGAGSWPPAIRDALLNFAITVIAARPLARALAVAHARLAAGRAGGDEVEVTAAAPLRQKRAERPHLGLAPHGHRALRHEAHLGEHLDEVEPGRRIFRP